MTEKLKPCPFCGGKASYKDIGFLLHTEHVYVVSCSACGCSTPINEDLIEAIKSWNKRVNVAKVTNNQFADVSKKGTMSLNHALIVLDRLNTTERIDVARDNLAEAVRVVSAAAKYRIPQKPEKSNINWYALNTKTCPTCKGLCLEKITNFCSNCGQALDWN